MNKTNFDIIQDASNEDKQECIDKVSKCCADICVHMIKRICAEQSIADFVEISNFDYCEIISKFKDFFNREVKK